MWNKGDVPDSCTQPKRNGVGGPWYGHVCGLKVQWAARAYRVCVASGHAGMGALLGGSHTACGAAAQFKRGRAGVS